jgi:hypothetical protein
VKFVVCWSHPTKLFKTCCKSRCPATLGDAEVGRAAGVPREGLGCVLGGPRVDPEVEDRLPHRVSLAAKGSSPSPLW